MPTTTTERFWAKVDKTDSCWLWTATANPEPKPYGRFWADGRMVLAHRFAYELLREPIPPDKQIDHLCRVHRCVNPDHLEVVTPSVNTLRGELPHRTRTHCLRCGHALEPKPWNGERFCRPCQRASDRRYYERKKLAALGEKEPDA